MRTLLKHFKQRLLRKHPHVGPHTEADASLSDVQPLGQRPQEEPHLDAELSDLDAVRGAGERLYAAEPDAALAAAVDAQAPHEQGSPALEVRLDPPSAENSSAAPDVQSDVERREPTTESLEGRPLETSSGLDASPQPALEGPDAGEGAVTTELEPERASALSRARQAVATRVSAAREKLSHGRFSSRKASRPKYSAIPIRVIMGYLPEVSERDAREYALGMAEKHFEQIGMAYFAVFEHERGFVYEIHEGGDGLAYAPEILKYFESQGPYRIGEHVSVHLRTATRMVEIERLREGLGALVLPESSDAQQTEWLVGTDKMEQALNRRTGLLLAGAGLFVTGFAAMLVAAFLARYQPYEEPAPVQTEYINAQDLPLSQWSRLESVQAPNYVRALRYRAGKWEAPEVATDAAAATPAPVTPTTPAPAGQ